MSLIGYKSMSGMPPVAKLSFSSHNAQVFKHDRFIPILVHKLTTNRICLIVFSCTNLSIKILTLFGSNFQHPIILVDPEGVGGGALQVLDPPSFPSIMWVCSLPETKICGLGLWSFDCSLFQ